jgi:hypothetical protein
MTQNEAGEHPSPTTWLAVILAWAAVGLPLGWGVLQTLKKAVVLLR